MSLWPHVSNNMTTFITQNLTKLFLTDEYDTK